jgi:hypothetical protein
MFSSSVVAADSPEISEKKAAETGHGSDCVPVPSKFSAGPLGASAQQPVYKDSAIYGPSAGSCHADDVD